MYTLNLFAFYEITKFSRIITTQQDTNLSVNLAIAMSSNKCKYAYLHFLSFHSRISHMRQNPEHTRYSRGKVPFLKHKIFK